MKRRWSSPEAEARWREAVSRAVSASNRLRWHDPATRPAMLAQARRATENSRASTSAWLLAHWADPEWDAAVRAKMSVAAKARRRREAAEREAAARQVRFEGDGPPSRETAPTADPADNRDEGDPSEGGES